MNFPEDLTRSQLSVSRPSRDVVVVTVSGDLSSLEAPRLREFLQQRLSACVGAVVVDLTEVSFFNSAGLETLAECGIRAAEQGVSLRLVCIPGGRVERLIDLVGIRERFVLRSRVDTTLSEVTHAEASTTEA